MNALFPPAIAKFLTPKVTDFPTEEYSGWEWRYNKMVFRPAQFKTEALILGALFLYYIFSVVVTTLKSRKAAAWVNSHQSLYDAQFSRPGNSDTLLADGPTDYFLFSTGRRAVAYLHTVISFVPSHDLVQVVYEAIMSIIDLSYSPKDTITLDFQLSGPPSPGFVLGLISKLHMKSLRKDRFDLTYFTKTSTNPTLPMAITLMAESSDVADALLKSAPGAALISKLADPASGQYFRSLIVSDQPVVRPTRGPIPVDKRHTQVTLSLDLPTNSDLAATEPIVRAVFDLIDFMDGGKLIIREDIIRKLSNTRQALDTQLTKEITEISAEDKEEAEEAKRAAKRKVEEEKFAALTPEQQKKHEEKERQRSMRKAQKKMASR
ncbi:hypothetical protein FRB96_007589 [Tulasnella sp. 330]|nr:hypothetical protein FRB96_007589 [Tulasnella sp. 330]KAG8884191.1 hypothetical protein FRB97_004970 [Tulasnella sp. 331]KAG8889150.1 hypothetical protein FRB98_005625 [Tulasnella sp. 332]